MEENTLTPNAKAEPGFVREQSETSLSPSSRRKFLGKLGAATVAAGVIGSGKAALAEPAQAAGPDWSGLNARVAKSYALRVGRATADSLVPVPPHTTNGDEQRYSDRSASYSKGLLQDDICVVNPAAWASFKKALNSGKMSDWENVVLGGSRTLNGPQGAYCYDMQGLDSAQFGNAPSPGDPHGLPLVPPFDPVNSAAYGTQLIEMYWGSLLRDVAFTDYANNGTAAAACAELASQPTYRGPRDINGNVTPQLLFRGNFPGEMIGPYISQLMITPTSMGQMPIDQLLNTYVAGIDYMLDPVTFLEVQNGISTGITNQLGVPCYLHNGRGLAAYTHVDQLNQAYTMGLMVLLSLGAPLNPGNPYIHSKTQNGFSTFGAADFIATMGEVAAHALDRVWYQKWLIHLTHRPEWGGGVLYQILSGNEKKIQARLNKNVLNSKAVAQSFAQNQSYFLSQAFPEGSPTHPSYPTGHGTVGGACITMLKFFFDETWVFPDPLVPSSDGLSLQNYTGGDAGLITVGGELNKLARNVSFGHGVHAGIHWRTDTDNSMLLGEAMAISYLQDRAHEYNEKFTITFTKLDGNKVTISNQ